MSTHKIIAIIDLCEDLEDTRQQAKVLYPLREIILAALCAVICGADSFVEMAEFGKAKLQFLRQFLPFERGIPSHDTFGSVFSNIESKKFSEIFITWIKYLQSEIPNLVAIDGKTLRRSMNGEIPPIHIISAWASEQNLVLGQTKTGDKSNEIIAIPELLEQLVIKKALVTIDAIGCQKKIAEKIIQKKADYLLSVKKNQRKLFDDIKLTFEAADSGTLPIFVDKSKTIDTGHGRIETRICSVISETKFLTEAERWPNLACIGKIHSIREETNKTSEETKYFIASRKLPAEDFAKAVRMHWTIENSLHWVMDIVFREDESRVRTRHAAANFVTLRHITLNMLKKLTGRQSMRVRRKRAGWDDDFLHEVLEASPEP